MMPPLGDAQRETLKSFLDRPGRPNDALGYHALQGFLFAVSCSPEVVAPSEWMSLAGIGGDNLEFENLEQAQIVLPAVMGLANEVNQAVLERSTALPEGCAWHDDVMANLEPTASMSQWSQGFLLGQNWLEEAWDAYVPDELDEALGAHMMVLSCFSSQRLAQSFHDELVRDKSAEAPDFEDYLNLMKASFGDAMAGHAHMARSIIEVLEQERESLSQPIRNESKVGRNEPCPCGSGKKYKKCCLHSVH